MISSVCKLNCFLGFVLYPCNHKFSVLISVIWVIRLDPSCFHWMFVCLYAYCLFVQCFMYAFLWSKIVDLQIFIDIKKSNGASGIRSWNSHAVSQLYTIAPFCIFVLFWLYMFLIVMLLTNYIYIYITYYLSSI